MTAWQSKLRDHLFWDYPREACGLLVEVDGKAIYKPCRNIALEEEHFVLHPEDFATAEDSGRVLMILHTHPFGNSEPSMADRVGCEKTNLPWGIMDRSGRYTEINPSGYKAPLIGRHFSYGVLDCFTLVRDYYKEKLGIELPDAPREGHWWKRGETKFDRFLDAGFIYVSMPEPNDVVVMRCFSKVPNHLGIYVGDGKMLHHPHDGLSCETTYRHEWQRVTAGFLRWNR